MSPQAYRPGQADEPGLITCLVFVLVGVAIGALAGYLLLHANGWV